MAGSLVPPNVQITVLASPELIADAARAKEWAPLEPCWVMPSLKLNGIPMYSPSSTGVTSVPRVISPLMSAFVNPASAMAMRQASAKRELVVLPG